MPVTAEQYGNYPIVVFTYSGDMTHKDVKQGIELNAMFVEKIGEPIYIIADYSKTKTSFKEILQIVDEAKNNQKSNVFDENIKMLILVGDDPYLKIYQNAMVAQGAVFGVANFMDLDDAIKAALLQIKMKT